MIPITEPFRTTLYKRIRHLLGAPIRGVEITDEMLDSFVSLSIEDYSEKVNNWLMESQWTSLYGLDLDNQSLTKAFMTRSLDWESQFTYAYSKIVGLQAGGDYVLKKDFIELKNNQQIYEIPRGRELNEVLWFSRSELDAAYFDPFMGGFGGFGGVGIGGGAGFSQMGTQGNYFVAPAFDLLLRMQDINIKRRIITGELTYKITALPDGKKALHLMNVPGGKFDFGNIQHQKFKVWYWYYDTEDREDCLDKNKDVIKLPSDIPFDKMKWDDLNEPAKTWVRRQIIAYTKESLSNVRGKFSGSLNSAGGGTTMDYQKFANEAKDEKLTLDEELLKRLDRLRPENMMEAKAKQAEELNKLLKYRAFPNQFKVI